MEIKLERLEKLQFKATNADGNEIKFDSSPDFGGEGKGIRPMEGVMACLAACASIDAVLILKKGRHEVRDYRVFVKAQRTGDIPKKFASIHLVFEIGGSFSEEAMKRAVKLSVEKYCSVGASLHPDIDITHEAIKLNP